MSKADMNIISGLFRTSFTLTIVHSYMLYQYTGDSATVIALLGTYGYIIWLFTRMASRACHFGYFLWLNIAMFAICFIPFLRYWNLRILTYIGLALIMAILLKSTIEVYTRQPYLKELTAEEFWKYHDYS